MHQYISLNIMSIKRCLLCRKLFTTVIAVDLHFSQLYQAMKPMTSVVLNADAYLTQKTTILKNLSCFRYYCWREECFLTPAFGAKQN